MFLMILCYTLLYSNFCSNELYKNKINKIKNKIYIQKIFIHKIFILRFVILFLQLLKQVFFNI